MKLLSTYDKVSQMNTCNMFGIGNDGAKQLEDVSLV